MQFIIMLAIVTGLAAADFVTGWASAFIRGDVKSSEMRKGGVRKMVEIVIMLTACGLNIGIEKLAEYTDSEGALSEIVGSFSAFAVCGYIALMEIISILENYCEIYPNARWAKHLKKKLGEEEPKDEKNEAGGP